jgi:CIC family chloride channel protein
VIIIFELTGDYRIILPLMFAIVVATALSGAVSRDTIYTLKLRRRGIDIDQPRATGLMAQIRVAEAMGRPPRPIAPDQPLPELVKRFATERTDCLPVVDSRGALVGVVAAVDLERAISQDPAQTGPTQAIVRPVAQLRADDSREDAAIALGATDHEGMPVVGDDDELVGWLTHRRLPRAYRVRSTRQRIHPAERAEIHQPVPDPMGARHQRRGPRDAAGVRET